MPTAYSTSRQYTPEQYAQILIQEYAEKIKALYNYGARKFILNSIGQIGCSPNELATRSADGSTCDAKINSASKILMLDFASLLSNLTHNFLMPDRSTLMFMTCFKIFSIILPLMDSQIQILGVVELEGTTVKLRVYPFNNRAQIETNTYFGTHFIRGMQQM